MTNEIEDRMYSPLEYRNATNALAAFKEAVTATIYEMVASDSVTRADANESLASLGLPVLPLRWTVTVHRDDGAVMFRVGSIEARSAEDAISEFWRSATVEATRVVTYAINYRGDGFVVDGQEVAGSLDPGLLAAAIQEFSLALVVEAEEER